MLSNMLVGTDLHLSLDAREWLDKEDCTNLKVYDRGISGWFIAVPADPRVMERLVYLPNALRLIVEHAVKLGCSWILLDLEGPLIDGLPTYE